jgi:hypothetical protein
MEKKGNGNNAETWKSEADESRHGLQIPISSKLPQELS